MKLLDSGGVDDFDLWASGALCNCQGVRRGKRSHSFSKYLLRTNYALGSVCGARYFFKKVN